MGKTVGELFKDLGFIFKFVETICCTVNCIMICVVHKNDIIYYSDRIRDLTVVGIITFLIICGTLMLVYIFSQSNHIHELILLFAGFVLNLVAGIMCFIKFFDDTNRSYALVIAVFAVTCGFVMIFDWVREFKKSE